MLLGTLQVRLGLDAATFTKKFNTFQKDVQRRAKGFQRSMQGLGNLGTMMGGAGITLGLKSVIDAAQTFESQMQGVKAVMSSLTGEEFATLSAKARELGATTRYSATEAASAIEMLAKNGLKTEDILGGALEASLAMAAATGAELPQAADIATDAMLVFGKTAGDLKDVINQISGVTQNSKFDINAYQLALASGGAAAVKAGKSYEEFNAVITATAGFFASGETAGTAFKVFTDQLVNDSAKAEKAQKLLGIQFFRNNGQLKDFTEIAEGLKTGLAGLSDQDAIASLTNIFGTRGANMAVALSRTGAEGIKTAAANIELADASAQAATRLESFDGKLTVLRSAMEGLKLSIADAGLLDFLGGLAVHATSLVTRLSKLPDWVKNLGLGFAAAAAALPFLAFGLSSIVGIIPIVTAAFGGITAFLLGPWGLAAVAGAAAIIAFKDDIVKAIGSIRAWFSNWVSENSGNISALGAAWSRFTGTLSPLFASLKQAIRSAVGTDASQLFENFGSIAGTALTTIVNAVTSVLGAAGDLSIWVSNTIPIIGQKIGDFADGWRDAFNGIMEWYNSMYGPFLSSMFEYIKSGLQTTGAILGLFFDAVKIVLDFIGDKLSQFGTWISQTEAFKVTVSSLSYAFKELGEGAQKYLKKMSDSLKAVFDTGKGYLDGIRDRINGVRDALKIFGDEGEHQKDKAVGNSWLTDLCEIGIRNFQALISSGINPAAGALKNFGAAGNGLSIGTMESPLRAQPAGGTADFHQNMIENARQFESAWDIALGNTQSAMDEFVRTGKLNFKGLVSSIIADFASAQLSKAVSALFTGVSGAMSGSGGGWGNIIGSVFSAFASFEGGGHTGTGSRTGGVDGRGGFLSILHPDETVIDHTKVAASARSRREKGGVNLSVPIHLQPGVSREELSRILPEVQRQIISIIPDLVQRGGRYASAFGQ